MKQNLIIGVLTSLATMSTALADDRIIEAELVGTVALSGGKTDDCAARLMRYKEERFLEFEVGFRSKSFTLTEESDTRWKGSFSVEVPGSSGFGNYTPAEKSKGSMEVFLDSEPRKARAVIENCIERTLLGTGLGVFRCRTTRFTCIE